VAGAGHAREKDHRYSGRGPHVRGVSSFTENCWENCRPIEIPLVSSVLFDKYVDFIDVYAEVTPEEQQTLYQDMTKHKESVMLAQYIKDKGKQEGILLGVQQGLEQGLEKGIEKGMIVTTKENIIEALELRFGRVSTELLDKINKINDIKELKSLYKKAILIKEIDPASFFSLFSEY